MKNTYHIDVTEQENALFREEMIQNEESKKVATPTSFKTAFLIVLVVHIAGAIALFAGPQIVSSKEPAPRLPAPTPTPVTATAAESNNNNAGPINPLVGPLVATNSQHERLPAEKSSVGVKSPLVKEYTVKSGDTFYQIVKKYKLNPKKLLELNNIKDPNKLVVGQKLKFL
jgi:LysM repeat protein